jgi:hypothetical protein
MRRTENQEVKKKSFYIWLYFYVDVLERRRLHKKYYRLKIALTRLNGGCEKLEIIVLKLFIFIVFQSLFSHSHLSKTTQRPQAMERDGDNFLFCD